MTQIIGLCGYGFSGKDEVARILEEEFGYSHRKFSQQIKDAYYALDPVGALPAQGHFEMPLSVQHIVDAIGWDEAKKLYPEIRRGLQRFGTEVGRELWGYNFWVDKAMWNLPRGSVVFSDSRFSNEWEAIRGIGGEIWNITRPGVEPVNEHASDNQWDENTKFEVVLDNDGTLEDLRKKVIALVSVTNLPLTSTH